MRIELVQFAVVTDLVTAVVGMVCLLGSISALTVFDWTALVCVTRKGLVVVGIVFVSVSMFLTKVNGCWTRVVLGTLSYCW